MTEPPRPDAPPPDPYAQDAAEERERQAATSYGKPKLDEEGK